jgi:signal transduction histidine kinase
VLSISVAEIKYYSKKFRIVSLKDITKELEEQELDSWHKLFRVITHEIMNSIAPITSLSQTLTRFYRKNGSHKSPDDINEKIITDTLSGLKVIDDMSNGLMSFVKNYRQLSKIPSPKIEKIEIKSWLLNLKTLMVEMTKNFEIALKITVSENCRTIYSDEKLLNQVVLNLIKNSIEALEESQSGEIKIQVQKTDENRTLLTIKDNGMGISDEDLDKIFVPFFTTKEHGNGIGLSLSKQIIRKLGGSLAIKSKQDVGTEVNLTL